MKLLKLMFICHEKEFIYKFIDLIKTNGFLFNRLVKVYKNYIVPPNFASVKFASLETKFPNIAKESNLIPFALYIAVYTLLVINFFHIHFKFVFLSPQIRFKFASYSFIIKFTPNLAMMIYSYGLHEEKIKTPLVTASKISVLSLSQCQAHCAKKSFFLGIAIVMSSTK